MQQAAARRAVMAGAEGERRLDLDRDVVRFDARAVVGAVNEKAPRANRREAGKRIGDPIALSVRPKVAEPAVASSEAAAISARSASSSGAKPK